MATAASQLAEAARSVGESCRKAVPVVVIVLVITVAPRPESNLYVARRTEPPSRNGAE